MSMNSKSRFRELIAVRFNEQELQRLREAAAEQGIGASTLVRILVNQALRPLSTGPRRMTYDEFRDVMASTLARMDKSELDVLLKDVSIGNPDDPMLLVWAGKSKKWEQFTAQFLKALLASLDIEVTLPENSEMFEEEEQPATSKNIKEQNIELKRINSYVLSKNDGGGR